MSDFEMWLKKLETDLKSIIKDTRSFCSYVDNIICNTNEFFIWKKSGQDEVIKEGNSTTVILAPLKSEFVKPVPIRLTLHNDWRGRYEEKVIIVLGSICRIIVSREEEIITQTLSKDIEAFDIKGEVIKRDELQEAIDYISSQRNYADTLLVNPLQLPKLMHEKSFFPHWNLSSQFVKSKGKRFIGLMGELSIYETPSLTEVEGLLYEKQYIKVRKTPLVTEFNNYADPQTLCLSEDIFAYAAEDGAIAKINLKKT